MRIDKFLKIMVEKDASDLFLRAMSPARLRINGLVRSLDNSLLKLKDIEEIVNEITNEAQKERFQKEFNIDYGFYSEELDHRFRVSLFLQRNTPALVIRKINQVVDDFEKLNLPSSVLKKLCAENRGLILLTGAAGSGKSTTISSMIEYINENADKHILTIEEPIEFTFKDKRSIINQRELGLDVSSYPEALRTFTLQSPDVIFLGNIRNQETMFSCMNAAETGVLVLSTLHTVNAPQSVERMINLFPQYQHQEMRIQLSLLLKAIISLRLVPLKSGKGRIPVYEVMLLTPTVSRLIREGKTWELPAVLEQGEIFGMNSFRQCLVKLVKEDKISEEDAYNFADNKDELRLALVGLR
jgi:pilus retraction protein PilT